MDEVLVDVPILRIFEAVGLDMAQWLESSMRYIPKFGSWTATISQRMGPERLTKEDGETVRRSAWLQRVHSVKVLPFKGGLYLTDGVFPMTNTIYFVSTDIANIVQPHARLTPPLIAVHDSTIPETIVQSMTGRPATDIVAHEILAGQRITHAAPYEDMGSLLHIHLEPMREVVRTTLSRDDLGD